MSADEDRLLPCVCGATWDDGALAVSHDIREVWCECGEKATLKTWNRRAPGGEQKAAAQESSAGNTASGMLTAPIAPAPAAPAGEPADTLPDEPTDDEIEGLSAIGQAMFWQKQYDALRQSASRLRGELAEAKGLLEKNEGRVKAIVDEELLRRAESANAALEAARVNEERYRLIRELPEIVIYRDEDRQQSQFALRKRCELDAAIDAARSGKGGT